MPKLNYEDAESIQNIICNLKDVIMARVNIDGTGEINEIHVLVESNRPPKQIVRDIESAIYAQKGIKVDYKQISIAQCRVTEPPFLSQEKTRIQVIGVDLSVDRLNAVVQVKLTKDSIETTGKKEGPRSQLLRLTASATLEAVTRFFEGENLWVVEDVATINIARKEIAMVLVNFVTPRKQENLIGSSVIQQDVYQAVVFATLDAINRYTGTLKTKL